MYEEQRARILSSPTKSSVHSQAASAISVVPPPLPPRSTTGDSGKRIAEWVSDVPIGSNPKSSRESVIERNASDSDSIRNVRTSISSSSIEPDRAKDDGQKDVLNSWDGLIQAFGEKAKEIDQDENHDAAVDIMASFESLTNGRSTVSQRNASDYKSEQSDGIS